DRRLERPLSAKPPTDHRSLGGAAEPPPGSSGVRPERSDGSARHRRHSSGIPESRDLSWAALDVGPHRAPSREAACAHIPAALSEVAASSLASPAQVESIRAAKLRVTPCPTRIIRPCACPPPERAFPSIFRIAARLG